MVTDQQFLWWLHERLVKVHGEHEMMGYMHRLRAIIVGIPSNNVSVCANYTETDVDILRERFKSYLEKQNDSQST
jgi:hypothetical protein